MKKTMIIAGIAIVAAVAVAMVVKHQSAQVKDSYFEPDKDRLREVPANLVVVRPTHFPQADGKINHYWVDDSLARTVGRDASFRNMMAEANDCNFTRVILPPDAPSGGYDFLVTTSGQVRQHLRSAIQKQLGYTAHKETRDTDVLILTVDDASLPGLTVSAADEPDGASLKDGKLYLRHEQMDTIVDGLAHGLNLPVLDETGLTNYYDYSVVWNDDVNKRMHEGGWHLDSARKVLAGWGLGLEATNVPLDMYVVEKMR
jgi:uncharacterized protein (TIGR03435 family)